MLALLDQTEPFVANETEAAIANEAAFRMSSVAANGQDIKIALVEDPSVIVPLPARAVQLIANLLKTMAERKPFSMIPHEAEFTTQQAADFLNVSRPFFVKLLEEGQIPHRKVGRHRRIRFAELLVFEDTASAKKDAALAELAAEERALGLD